MDEPLPSISTLLTFLVRRCATTGPLVEGVDSISYSRNSRIAAQLALSGAAMPAAAQLGGAWLSSHVVRVSSRRPFLILGLQHGQGPRWAQAMRRVASASKTRVNEVIGCADGEVYRQRALPRACQLRRCVSGACMAELLGCPVALELHSVWPLDLA
ncbi:hypothetical protein GY45DRAFT_382167 [Cubamyces sp. BRFM 1775]|nr:hypothetical protein GY45DRAFT_382167 [Cubamyces sp. BRFM 1775]